MADENNQQEMLDFYRRLRRKIRGSLAKRKKKKDAEKTAYDRLVEFLALLPDLFHLAIRLLFDKEMPAKNKGALIAGIAYVVSPIDLIPDTVPIAGWVDDLIVITMAIHKFVDTDDEKVKAAVTKYWAGEEDVFERVKHILDVADAAIEFLPKKLIQIMKGIFQ